MLFVGSIAYWVGSVGWNAGTNQVTVARTRHRRADFWMECRPARLMFTFRIIPDYRGTAPLIALEMDFYHKMGRTSYHNTRVLTHDLGRLIPASVRLAATEKLENGSSLHPLRTVLFPTNITGVCESTSCCSLQELGQCGRLQLFFWQRQHGPLVLLSQY